VVGIEVEVNILDKHRKGRHLPLRGAEHEHVVDIIGKIGWASSAVGSIGTTLREREKHQQIVGSSTQVVVVHR
jgi:hypothetical protein